MKLLYLAQRPSRGAIRMFGTDVITMPRDRLPELRRRLGVVFQDFRLVPHLTAFDNVALPLRVSGVAEADLRGPVSDMMEWVGLGERMDARPRTLSGGEQQRVAIARAVIGRPDMLVADEPTGNVDPEMALKLLRLFESLNRLGTTVVVATHDVHLLKKVPQSLIMRLEKGRLSDPTGALRNPPRPTEARRAESGAEVKAPPAPREEDTRGARRFGGSRAAQLVPQPRLSGPMPWVIAVMVALTVIAAAGGLSLANMAAGARAETGGRRHGADHGSLPPGTRYAGTRGDRGPGRSPRRRHDPAGARTGTDRIARTVVGRRDR